MSYQPLKNNQRCAVCGEINDLDRIRCKKCDVRLFDRATKNEQIGKSDWSSQAHEAVSHNTQSGHTCPKCGQRYDLSWKTCMNCNIDLPIVEKKDTKKCLKCGKTYDSSWRVCLYCQAKLEENADVKEQPEQESPSPKKIDRKMFIQLLSFAFLTGIGTLISDVFGETIGFDKLGIGINIPMLLPILIYELFYVARVKKEYQIKPYHHAASIIAFLMPIIFILATIVLINNKLR
jgi:hypothetical protein